MVCRNASHGILVVGNIESMTNLRLNEERNVRFKCHSPIVIRELVAAFVISFRTHHLINWCSFNSVWCVYPLPICTHSHFAIYSVPDRCILFVFLIVCASRIGHTPQRMCKHSNGSFKCRARQPSLIGIAAFQPRPIYTVTNTFRNVQYVQCSNMAPATTTGISFCHAPASTSTKQ